VSVTIDVPACSAVFLGGGGAIWATTPRKNKVDARGRQNEQCADTIPSGPGQRFETFGAGTVWTLNQVNGATSCVDVKTRKVIATIEVGIAGDGGRIAFGLGRTWATGFEILISEIDPRANRC
jgi:YVTN family beta-propeller protein